MTDVWSQGGTIACGLLTKIIRLKSSIYEKYSFIAENVYVKLEWEH